MLLQGIIQPRLSLLLGGFSDSKEGSDLRAQHRGSPARTLGQQLPPEYGGSVKLQQLCPRLMGGLPHPAPRLAGTSGL